jgi:hypothetical protein
MYQFISGLLVMGYAVAGSFFVKYWSISRDRLFAWFATAFWVLAAQRAAIIWSNPREILGEEEQHPGFYLFRLFAFMLIIAAIVDKNYSRRRAERDIEKTETTAL